MLSEEEILKGCKKFNPVAQQLLYKKYVSSMRVLCVRYCKDREEAKDVLQEGFLKIFMQIDKYSNSGSVEGWMRKIMVNTAISHYKKAQKYAHEQIEIFGVNETENEVKYSRSNLVEEENEDVSIYSEASFTQEELLEAMGTLPESYRLVFNMYHVEGFSHADIGAALGFEEKTSRTRLFRARKMLQEYLQQVASRKIDY